MAECSFVSRDGTKCQFADRAGARTYRFQDRPYCIFHAPLDYKKTWPNKATEVESTPGIDTFISDINRESNSHFADFSGTVFPPIVSLGLATSSTVFNFSECVIGVNCSLSLSAHSGPSSIIFNYSRSEGSVGIHLHGAALSSAEFRYCTFSGHTQLNCRDVRLFDVRESAFLGPVEFRMGHITHTANFDRARFHGPIDFAESTFPQNTSLRGTRFLRGVYVAELESSYRHLRKTLAENKARDEEGLLFVVEQRSARLKYPWFSARRWCSVIYDVISRFGSSFERAFVYLVLIQLAALATYYALAESRIDGQRMNELVIFTLSQVLRPFEIFSAAGYAALKHSLIFLPSSLSYVPYIAAAQTMSTLVVFALFVLALRRRFMRE